TIDSSSIEIRFAKESVDERKHSSSKNRNGGSASESHSLPAAGIDVHYTLHHRSRCSTVHRILEIFVRSYGADARADARRKNHARGSGDRQRRDRGERWKRGVPGQIGRASCRERVEMAV